MRNERMMITSLRLSQIRRLSHSHAFFELPSSSPAWSVAFIVTCCHILMMDSYAKSSSNFPMASSDLRLLWVARCRDQPWHREMAPRVINLGVDRCPIGIFTSTWLPACTGIYCRFFSLAFWCPPSWWVCLPFKVFEAEALCQHARVAKR